MSEPEKKLFEFVYQGTEQVITEIKIKARSEEEAEKFLRNGDYSEDEIDWCGYKRVLVSKEKSDE